MASLSLTIALESLFALVQNNANVWIHGIQIYNKAFFV